MSTDRGWYVEKEEFDFACLSVEELEFIGPPQRGEYEPVYWVTCWVGGEDPEETHSGYDSLPAALRVAGELNKEPLPVGRDPWHHEREAVVKAADCGIFD